MEMKGRLSNGDIRKTRRNMRKKWIHKEKAC